MTLRNLLLHTNRFVSIGICSLALLGSSNMHTGGQKSTEPQGLLEYSQRLRQIIRKDILEKLTTIRAGGYYALAPDLPQEDAKKIVAAVRKEFDDLLQPYTKEIVLKDKGGDTKLRMLDLKKLEAASFGQLMKTFHAVMAHLEEQDPLERRRSLVKHYTPMIADLLSDAAVDLILFDEPARIQLSQLLLKWFELVAQEGPKVITLFKNNSELPYEDDEEYDKYLLRKLNLFFDQLAAIQATSCRPYERTVAVELAFWHVIIMQGLIGEKAAIIFLEQLPNYTNIKTAYDRAVAALVKQGIPDDLGRDFTSKSLVWIIVGVLFMPERFHKPLIDEIIRLKR